MAVELSKLMKEAILSGETILSDGTVTLTAFSTGTISADKIAASSIIMPKLTAVEPITLEPVIILAGDTMRITPPTAKRDDCPPFPCTLAPHGMHVRMQGEFIGPVFRSDHMYGTWMPVMGLISDEMDIKPIQVVSQIESIALDGFRNGDLVYSAQDHALYLKFDDGFRQITIQNPIPEDANSTASNREYVRLQAEAKREIEVSIESWGSWS